MFANCTNAKRADRFAQMAIVFCFYNSDLIKSIETLSSIADQEGVTYEIIIADDGSDVDNTGLLLKYLISRGIDQARIRVCRSDHNRGTVSNIRCALEVVNAPYVKCVSPGDCLYGCDALARIYQHFCDAQADIVFGRAIHYDGSDGIMIRAVRHPILEQRFDTVRRGKKSAMEALMDDGDAVLGAAMACRTDLFLGALKDIEGHVRYVEDNTALAWVLFQGGSVSPLAENVIWYEDGSGISTSNDDAWSKRIADDFISFWEVMEGKYPANKQIKRHIRFIRQYYKGGIASVGARVKKYLFHPRRVYWKIEMERSSAHAERPICNTDELLAYMREADSWCRLNMAEIIDFEATY